MLLAAIPARAAAPPPAELELAADSGTYLLFRNAAAITSDNLHTIGVDTTLLSAQKAVRGALGFDALDLTALAPLAGGAEGPVAASLGIVDAAAVARLTAADSPPTDKPFAVRFLVVLPIADAAATTAAVDRLLRSSPACARAASRPASTCAADHAAVKATVDAAHHQLRWVVAIGLAGVAGAAAALLPLAPPADRERLRGEALGSGQAAALRATPDAEARAFTAVALVPLATMAASLKGEMRRKIWRQAVLEAGGLGVLAASKPRLFSDVLATDQGTSWGLTPDGEALFASLALPPRADSKLLIERLPGKLGPKLDRSGPFAQPKQLTELIQNAGQQSWVLLAHFLWPHGLAALGEQGSPPSGSMGSGRVDLDRPHHRLVIRP